MSSYEYMTAGFSAAGGIWFRRCLSIVIKGFTPFINWNRSPVLGMQYGNTTAHHLLIK